MSKVIINQNVLDSLPYPLYELRKILTSKGFDLTKKYNRTDDTKYHRITFTQNEQLECSS
jgi:hypothetical protein